METCRLLVHGLLNCHQLVFNCHDNNAFVSFLEQYDCSSADINPIGSISKQDLRAFLRWAAVNLEYSSLADVEAAPPTAELEPIRSDYSQVLLQNALQIVLLLLNVSNIVSEVFQVIKPPESHVAFSWMLYEFKLL